LLLVDVMNSSHNVNAGKACHDCRGLGIMRRIEQLRWIDPVSRKITIDDDLLQIAVNPD
jgi:excinuclease UvrABC ATPase subunit